MAFIDASGLSQSTATPQARGSILVTASGLSLPVATPKAAGSLIHGAAGIVLCQTIALGHLAKWVEFTSAAALSNTKIRITFDRPMLNNSALRAVASYDINPKFSTGAPLTLIQIQPEGVSNPTFVDITTTEMTDGETYIAEIHSPAGPVDLESVPVNPTANTKEYAGIGVDPEIESVIATGANTVEVKFNEAMDDNSALRNVAWYSFDNGLNVLSISKVVKDTVTLVTSDQMPGVLYELTIVQP